MSKIVSLEISNVQKIKYATINPDGSLFRIAGRNAQGKTSILNAIQALYAGGHRRPDKLLRDGATKGHIKATEDNGVTTRLDITKKSQNLRVTDETGEELKKPQSVCDAKLPAIAFEPLEFAGMNRLDKLNCVKQIAGIDFSSIDAEEAKLREERTVTNRQVKALEVQLDALPPPTAGPTEEISVSELVAELERRRKANNQRAKAIADIDNLISDLEGTRVDAHEAQQKLKNEIEELKQRINQCSSSLELHIKEESQAHQQIEEAQLNRCNLLECQPEENTAEIEAKIQTAETDNAAVRQRQERAKVEDQLAQATIAADEIQHGIDTCLQTKRDMVSNAAMPMKGLSIEADSVTYNGIPLEQCSDSEKHEISMEIGFALAPTPDKLQVMLIRKGSLLDADTLARLNKKAEERGWLVFVELVGEDGDIVIEDGMIKEIERENK